MGIFSNFNIRQIGREKSKNINTVKKYMNLSPLNKDTVSFSDKPKTSDIEESAPEHSIMAKLQLGQEITQEEFNIYMAELSKKAEEIQKSSPYNSEEYKNTIERMFFVTNTPERAVLIDKFLSNEHIYGNVKTMRISDPILRDTNTPEACEAKIKIIDKILSDERLFENENIMSRLNWALENADTKETAEARISIIDKIYSDERLFENKDIKDIISVILFNTNTREEAEIKSRLADRYLNDEHFHNDANSSEYISSILAFMQTPLQKSLTDKALDNEELFCDKNIMLDIINLIYRTNTPEQAVVTDKVITDENLHNSENVMKNINNIVKRIKSSGQSAIADKFLSDKRLYDNENFINNLDTILFMTTSEDAAKSKIAVIDKVLSNTDIYDNQELTDKIITYILSSNFSQEQLNTVEKYMQKGLNIESSVKLVKHNINLTKTIPIADVDSAKQKDMFVKFFSNKKGTVDNVIRNADFAKYGRHGLPLEYSRSEFLKDLSSVTSAMGKEQRDILISKLGIQPAMDMNGNISAYDGFLDNSRLDLTNPEEKKVYELTDKFINNNKIITGNGELDTALNALMQGMPEFVNIIGKQQHYGHAYSLDIHTLEVYRNILLNEEYNNLSDFDKTRIKMAAILHDTGKPEGRKDPEHAITSANYANSILKRYKPMRDDSNRYGLLNLILNHHWNEQVSKSDNKPAAIQKAAALIGNEQDMCLERIFSKSDIEAIGLKLLLPDYEEEVAAALKEMNKTKPLAYNTPVVIRGKFPQYTFENGKKAGVLILKDVPDDTDMEQYGFLPGTKAKDVILAVHAANSQAEFNAFDILQTPEAGSPQSISFVTKENNPLFKRFGIVLDIEAKNVINATHYDQGSGTAKAANQLAKFAANDGMFEVWRKQLPDLVKKSLNIDDTAYSDLAGQVEKYRYITQIKDIQKFKVKNDAEEEIVLTGKDVKNAIMSSNQKLVEMAAKNDETYDKYHPYGDITEYIVRNAKNTGIYYVRYDKPEDAKEYPELKDFLDELPAGAQIIFGGYKGYTFSRQADLWNKENYMQH